MPKPSKGMVAAARRIKALRAELPPSRRGLTGRGLRMMNKLAAGGDLTRRDILDMFAFVSRFGEIERGEGFRRGEKGYPSKLRIAWDAWGGDAAVGWVRRQRAALD